MTLVVEVDAALTKDRIYCNLNHVLQITECFLKREPDLSLSWIMNINLPFKVLDFIDFPLSAQFLIDIFQFNDCFTLSKELTTNIYKYAVETDFFTDLIRCIIEGEQGFDETKSASKYKPEAIKKLIHLGKDISPSTDTTNFIRQNIVQACIPELQRNFMTDIDRMKTFITHKKKLKTENFRISDLSRSKSTSNIYQLSNMEMINKYPSLREKWEEMQRAPQPGHDDDRRDDLSTPGSPDRRLRHAKTGFSNPNQSPQPLDKNLLAVATPKRGGRAEDFAFSKRGSDQGAQALKNFSDFNLVVPQSNVQSHGDSFASSRSNVTTQNEKRRPVKPTIIREEKITTPTAFPVDETSKRGAEQILSQLYPPMVKLYIPDSIEKEAMKKEFAPFIVKENDDYNLALAECLHIMIRKAIEDSVESTFKAKLMVTRTDYTDFWNAMLGGERARNFDVLMKVTIEFFLEIT